MVAHNSTQQRKFRKKLVEIRPPLCQQCGTPFPYEDLIADHITESWRGGSNDPEANGRLICQSCDEIKTRDDNKHRPTPYNGKAGPPERKFMNPFMDQKRPTEMPDTELVREWSCIEDCDFSKARANKLRAELEKRQLAV